MARIGRGLCFSTMSGDLSLQDHVRRQCRTCASPGEYGGGGAQGDLANRRDYCCVLLGNLGRLTSSAIAAVSWKGLCHRSSQPNQRTRLFQHFTTIPCVEPDTGRSWFLSDGGAELSVASASASFELFLLKLKRSRNCAKRVSLTSSHHQNGREQTMIVPVLSRPLEIGGVGLPLTSRWQVMEGSARAVCGSDRFPRLLRKPRAYQQHPTKPREIDSATFWSSEPTKIEAGQLLLWDA